jgi:hypothetical protein
MRFIHGISQGGIQLQLIGLQEKAVLVLSWRVLQEILKESRIQDPI